MVGILAWKLSKPPQWKKRKKKRKREWQEVLIK